MPGKGIAIITGASKGIGACVAQGLAADGYKTILIARNAERLERITHELSQNVPAELKPEYIAMDITDHKKVSESLRELQLKYTPISILVNSAGMWLDGTLDETEENFQKLLDVNLISPFVFLREIAQAMKKNRHGHIFNISSRAGIYGFAGGGLYSASKFGLSGLSDSLYREMAEVGVKVTSLCPGWVNTQMAVEAKTPWKEHEMIQPEDILNSIRYILNLSGSACVREIVLECTKSVL
ncbi:MAG: SDR family oxidoreductase [Ignavibacteriae bacterium]|nr:MAG: SDR family oxidoreductase [Ignavibacteriota bacterium]